MFGFQPHAAMPSFSPVVWDQTRGLTCSKHLINWACSSPCEDWAGQKQGLLVLCDGGGENEWAAQ